MSLETLIADPDFQAQDFEVKRQILSSASPNFKAKSLEDQNLALTDISQISTPTPTDPRASARATRDQALAEREAAGQAFVASQQRPTLEKYIEQSVDLAKGLAQPFVGMAKGAMALPEVANTPSSILPSLQEGGRRVVSDISSLAQALPELLYKYGTIPGNLQRLGQMAPRTPSSQETQAFLESLPLQQEQAKERETIQFKGANPAFSEGIAQVIETVPPIKAGQLALKGINVAKAPVERILRTAMKPSKQIAGRLEASTKSVIDEVYHAAPDADKLGSMPLEGFQQTVNQVKKSVGAEIDEGLKASGTPLTAGDDIAAELNARADRLVKAGQPAETVQALRDRANDISGQLTDMDSLRLATTTALRENSPLFTRTREAANPLRSKAETIANEIISKKGGEIENAALGAIKGPEGARLRKKWSDLTLVEKQASDQLNKIINSGTELPPSAQSALVEAFTSPQGAVGLFGLINGWASAAPAALGAVVRSWAKRQSKALKDSNSLVISAYEKMRANPPAVPAKTLPMPPPVVATPPIQPPTLSQLISQLSGSGTPTTLGSGPALGASAQELNAAIQQVIEQQAAQQAASTAGFF